MKTDLVVSCPQCGKEITVRMGHEENPIAAMIAKELNPDLKQYNFAGNENCSCGKIVLATLTVTG